MATTLHGQVLLTEAVGGLGTAMTRRLLSEGYTIIACDRAGASLEDLPAEQQDRVSFYPLDVTKEDQVNTLAGELRAKSTNIAYLINNAGISGAGQESRCGSGLSGSTYMGRFI